MTFNTMLKQCAINCFIEIDAFLVNRDLILISPIAT